MIEVIIAGIIVLIIGIPLVIKFDKWKKEMEDDLKNHNTENR